MPGRVLRFLFQWQRVADESRAEGPDGLAAVLDLLDGYEVAAGAWETDVLPARLREYDPLWLDGLCLSGEIAWGRLAAVAPRTVLNGGGGRKAGPVRSTPVALFRRERGAIWRSLFIPSSSETAPRRLDKKLNALRASGSNAGLARRSESSRYSASAYRHMINALGP